MSNQKQLTKPDWDAIGEDVAFRYLSGQTAKEIAEHYDLNDSTVQQYLYREGIHKSQEQINEARARGVESRLYDPEICTICNGKFEPKSGNQKYCKTCIPNLAARKRYEAYKITQLEWERLLAKQNGTCKLCPEPATVVDHNHKNGDPRGLLCVACNAALNRMELDGWSDRAAKYLQKNMAISTREYWLIWRLIESLRDRNIPFEGRSGEFAGDFDRLRDKCIDRAYDYKPEEG
jgi:hypothetical protein